MSDALTDIARDERRAECFENFGRKVIEFIKNPNNDTRQEVTSAAKNTDNVVGGYWSRDKTNLEKGIDGRLDKLQNGDNEEWSGLLFAFDGNYKLWDELKAVSPFSDMVVVFIEYGMGKTEISGELEEAVKEVLLLKETEREGRNRYCIVMPKINSSEIKTIWVGRDPRYYNIPPPR